MRWVQTMASTAKLVAAAKPTIKATIQAHQETITHSHATFRFEGATAATRG